ncbi:MAG: prepilin peptidase [Dehalococcoidia bacterium]|nr:prepilin peptidase [Dehalococcoidia bacterium]
MEVLLLYSVLGLAFGSFLNVLIDRLPRDQSIAYPASHCPSCKTPLAVFDLVPVLSYLLLRGRCRYCRVSIPLRILLVELSTGVLFGSLWWFLGPGTKLILSSAYFSILLVITVIDLEHRRILNKIIYPAILVSPFAAIVYGASAKDIFLGGLIGFLLMLLPYILSGVGLGAGDVKLAAFIGIFSGYPAILVAMFGAAVFGGVAAGFLLLTHLRGRKDPVPYAPFLALGGVVALIWSEQLISWYLGFY